MKPERPPRKPPQADDGAPALWSLSEIAEKARRWEWLLLLGIVMSVVLVRINLIDMPYERDEGAYIYFGQMILDGQTPYRDFYEDKPPGNMYSYAALNEVFGPFEGNQHGAFMLLNIATLLLLYFAVRRWLGTAPALSSSIMFATLSLSRALAGFTCLSEHIVIFFVAAGMWLLLDPDEPPPWRLLLAGAAFGMSCWIKQSGVFFLLWGAVAAGFAAGSEASARRRLEALLWFLGGAAAVSAGFLALVARLGVFREFWFSVVELPRLFVTYDMPAPVIKAGLMHYLGGIVRMNFFAAAMTLAGLVSIPFAPLSRVRKSLVVMLALCSMLTVVPGFTFYNHYWLQALPAAAVAVGVAAALLCGGVRRLGGASPAVSAALVTGLFACGALWNSYGKLDYYFDNDYSLVLRQTYGYNPFPSSKIVGDYLRTHTDPGEKLAVFGAEPEIFLYSRCVNATRHAFISHFMDSRNPYAKQWQSEYMADIEKAAPRYFVVVMNPFSLNIDPSTGQNVLDWATRYIGQHYDRVGVADDSVPGSNYPRLVWGQAARTYVPAGDRWVGIYKRKSS